MVSFFSCSSVGREEQQGRLWGMQCGTPDWRSNGRREARRGGGVRKERGKRSRERIFLGTERRVRAKGNVGHLPVQTMVTGQTPGRSNSTPGEPEGNHLKFKDKWAEGEGVAAVCEEPPRSPSQATLSVGTGRCTLVESSGEGPLWTNLEQDHEHLLEVAGGVANDVSLQVSLVGCKVGTQALVPSPGHPRDPGERSLLPPNDQILVTNPKLQSP